MQQKNIRSAENHYVKMVQLLPNSAQVQVELVMVCVALRDKNRAVRHLREAVRLDPEFARLQRLLDE